VTKKPFRRAEPERRSAQHRRDCRRHPRHGQRTEQRHRPGREPYSPCRRHTASGTVTFTANDVTYTADEDFVSGTDTFSYTLKDGHGGSDTATVTVQMVEVTD